MSPISAIGKSISLNLIGKWESIADDDSDDGERPVREANVLPSSTAMGVHYSKEMLDMCGHSLAVKNSLWSNVYFDWEMLDQHDEEQVSVAEADLGPDFPADDVSDERVHRDAERS